MKLVSYVAAELYSCISPVHVAPPCGCILTVQLVAELGLWFQLFAFIIFVSFSETLPWRRVADLHVLISSAISAMLGWTLYKEQITQLFQKEEGRYASPDLRKTNRLRIFRLSIQKNVLPIRRYNYNEASLH